MRILQIHNPHREWGGEDVVVERERELLERTHAVKQLLVANPDSSLAATGAMLAAPWNPRSARKVLEVARQFGPDVVHVHNTWYSLSPSIFGALSAAGWPIVSTVHNFRSVCLNGLLLRDGQTCELCVGRNPLPGIRHRCYRGSAVLSASASLAQMVPKWKGTWTRHVSRFIVLDDSMTDTLVAGGIPADRVTVKPNAVADPGPRLLVPSASTKVVYAGRLSHEKGVDLLVAAWAKLQPAGLELVIYGDGPLRQQLEAQRTVGVTFMGRCSPQLVAEAMRSGRALAFPSTCREAGPLAPIEAAAAGLPVVISDLVGVASQIQRQGAGWPFASSDLDSLVDALSRLQKDQDLDDAGRAARLMYEDRHSESTALRTLEGIYAAARAERTRPAGAALTNQENAPTLTTQ